MKKKPKKLRLFMGTTRRGNLKHTHAVSVLASNQKEARAKMRNKHGKGKGKVRVVYFAEDGYSIRGARWSRNGRRII